MILVIGATGTIGSELVQQLFAAGHQVRVFTRDGCKVAYLDHRIERAIGNLDNPNTLESAMQDVDKIFLVTLGTPQQDINAVEAATKLGVQHIVKLSTLEASHPTLQIGKWHREREQIIEASGISWTFIRPGMFMSNFVEWWSDSIKHMGMVFFPGGHGKVAPIHPYDVAAVAAVSLTQPGHTGQIYELTGPELLTIGEMVDIIAQGLGKSLRYVDIPPFLAKIWMRGSGMDKQLVEALMELASVLRKNQQAVRTNMVEDLTGSPPRTVDMWCQENIAKFR